MSYRNRDIAACGHATCPSRRTCLRWQLGQTMEDYHWFGEFKPKDGQCKYYMYHNPTQTTTTMRTIKFRGKRLHDGKWVYGYVLGHDTLPYMAIVTMANTDKSVINKTTTSVDPGTIGQFTGLCDKNGKEIYEGDIISSEESPQIKHLIFYNEKLGKFMAGLYGKTNIYDFGVCGVDIPAWMAEREVIGNIHDNPKLLENEKD